MALWWATLLQQSALVKVSLNQRGRARFDGQKSKWLQGGRPRSTSLVVLWSAGACDGKTDVGAFDGAWRAMARGNPKKKHSLRAFHLLKARSAKAVLASNVGCNDERTF